MMTRKNFFESIVEGTVVTAEMVEFAAKEIEKDAKAAAHRAEKSAEKKAEVTKEMEDFVAALGTEAATAAVLREKCGFATVQKASAIARKAVEAGLAEAVDVKVPKKGTQKAYRLPDEAATDNEEAPE